MANRESEPEDVMEYVVIELAEPSAATLDPAVPESKWMPFKGDSDWWYRVDPADPDKKIKRHVHITRKKHKGSKNKQVSWNDDGSRHDKSSFDDGMSGIDKARKIGREVLGLPDDIELKHIWAGSHYTRDEDAALERNTTVAQPIVILREASKSNGQTSQGKATSAGTRRLRVDFYKPGDENSGRRPMFKYMVSAEPGAGGTFKISITSLDPQDRPGAAAAETRIMKAADLEEALLSGQALLNSHHAGLKAAADFIEQPE